MLRCYITDRHQLANGQELLDVIARNLLAGVNWIQIREKDLSGRDLYRLVGRALELPNPHQTQILVNSRADVAFAAGAQGVHLPSYAPSPALWRRPDLLWGVSCHSLAEVLRAEEDGANYVVFGPVFPPLSKSSAEPALGLDALAEAAHAVKIPVLALGGVTTKNAGDCVAFGAAGIAGISFFQKPC